MLTVSSCAHSNRTLVITRCNRSNPLPRLGLQRKCVVYDLHDQVIPYDKAWKWQKQQLEQTLSQTSQGSQGAVILLQHEPVYTLGAGSTINNLKFNIDDSPIALYRTERGGEVTYHGPGQLVMYPILNLQHYQPDLHWYLRMLEEVVIKALDDVSGLAGERIPGLTGVWVEGHKLAAIGIRAKKWVTYHGLALNITADLAPFRNIVPCGIVDKPVGSVQLLLEQKAMYDDAFAGVSAVHPSTLLKEYSIALLDAFAEVFDVELQTGDANDLLAAGEAQL